MSVVLLLPVMAMGQFVVGPGGDTGKPWETFKLNPKTRLKLDYRNANVDMILSMYQKATGITIVKDPTLTGGLTLTSASPVGLNDAFQILATTLSLKGFDMVKEGNLLVIKAKNKNANQGGGRPTFDPSMFAGLGGDGAQSQPKLQVYPIKYANASQLARVLNEVFTPSTGGTNPFARFGGGNPFQFRGGGGGGRGNFPGAGGAVGGNPFQGFNFGQGQQPNVRASSDDFSNSVIVNAPENDQRQVAELIRQLDKQTDEPIQSRVFKLQFAASDDLVPVIQNVLSANAPRGRGGATTQANQGPGAFLNALRGQTAGSGTVTSDPYTNSLIVNATPENMALVTKVINELDVKIESQSSTVVIPLRNAKADDVAGLLNQAFGQRQGTGTNRAGGGNNAQNRNNQNRTNQNRANNGGGGLRSDNGTPGNDTMAQEIPLDLQDPNATSGELMTQVVAQGFGGQFGGQQQRRNQTGAQQTARDANGNVVNVRDLTGQVTTIADPNTNSIIVVTTPENADIIRGIIEQIDRIPEQVMIETIITEATLDASSKFGVEWKYAQTRPFGTPGTTGTGGTGFGLQNANPALQGFSYTLTGGSLTAFLNLLQQDDKFRVLSTPRIFTSNNVQAEINISQSVPYITSSRQDANGNFTYNYTFTDIGIVLNVTPRITSNGYVTMEVSQTANDLVSFTDFGAPVINKRQADTTVSVKDGETIILGGIIRTTVTASVKKIPLLGDLPVLGNLFKSTSRQNQKTELLVFLTPRIVRDPAEARRLREEATKELNPDTQKGLQNLIKPNTPPPAGNGAGNGTGTGDKKNGGS
jgi:general secretion pathway protein D